ncbi:hypothetical protein L1987_23343 [Smallanthus sonchifolius]|uniref:Uncharacterized protein n=1 Tax=Smallanthus sonchifolius TaxID=185202 RepID=A0ACB9IIV1_9ASTR|nr:hypothetical protein L1987_23343 [Smallanthus sonchifolius]
MADTSMIKTCDICGDPGVTEAIFTCSECKVAHEHLYCMRELRTKLPTFWRCEDCDRNKLVLPKRTDKEQKTQKISTLMERSPLVVEGPNKNHIASQFNFKEKWVDKGKTKYLSCDEAVKLSSGSMKINHTPRKEFHSAQGMSKSMSPPRVFQQSTGLKEKATPSIKSPARERTSIKSPQEATPSIKSPARERTSIKSPQEERNFKANLQQPIFQQSSVPKEKATPSIKSPARERTGIKSPQEERNSKANLQQPVFKQSSGPKEKAVPLQNRGNATQPVNSAMPSRRVERTNPEREMNTTKNELLSSKKEADIIRHIEVPKVLKKLERTETSGCKNAADVEAGRSDAVTPNLACGLPVSEMRDPFIPSLNSYWKGWLYIPNGPRKFNGAFKAHPPSRTNCKVYETLKKMPETIHFELVPDHEIRMEIFPAERDDIGLYFLPIFKRSEDDRSIIDFISSQNLVMKGYVDGVELLVLSSRVLPSHCQEFQGNYFLWGVFRRRKTVKKVADKRPLMEANREPCGDVPPGFKKICMPKREPCDDVPPGFKICNRKHEPCDDVPPGFKKM